MIGLKKEFASTSMESWIDQLKKDLKGVDFDKLLRKDALEDIEYSTFHHAESSKIESQSPGYFPFTRGLKTKSNEWNNGFKINVTSAETANAKSLDVLMKGCDLLIFDFNNSSFNWEILFKEIQFKHIKAQFTLRTKEQYLGLKEYFSDESPENIYFSFDYFHYSENVELFEILAEDFKSKQSPFLLIDGYSINQNGATTSQEIAFCISTAHEYIVQLMKKGYSIDQATACIHFSIGIGSNYFYEIAKIRALKQVWASVVKEYKPIHSCSYNCVITAQTGFINKSLADPYSNLLRQTTEAMSAISGGIESLVIQAYDAISEKGASILAERMALNISLILKEESYFDKVIDPLGGSYAIEDLTQKIAEKSWDLFQEIEGNGGIFNPNAKAILKNNISEKAALRLAQISSNEKILIGINKFQNPNPEKNHFVGTENYLGMSNLIFERELTVDK
jgi:methylmalonyl-CoA mutase